MSLYSYTAPNWLCIQIKHERFNDIRETAVQKRKNSLLKPTVHATRTRLRLLSEHAWDNEEKLAALEAITCQDVVEYGKEVLKDLRIEAFLHGMLRLLLPLTICCGFLQHVFVSLSFTFFECVPIYLRK